MEPVPDDAPPGAYGGSRLSTGFEEPAAGAFAGRGTAPEVVDVAGLDVEIVEAIAGRSSFMTELLTELVRAPTTLGNEEPGQRVIDAALRSIGLEPVDVFMDERALRAHPQAAPFDWRVEGKRNVVAVWGPDGRPTGRSLILNGHIDVVSPEPLSQWAHRDPFGGAHEDGWIVGRGAADMKCGLAAIVGAVGGLRSLGLTPKAPVIIESVVEEECTGNGTLQTLIAGYSADAAVIAEPFGAAITTSQVGVLWFSVRITGIPGHAAEGRHATNAIEESLGVIGALRSLEAELNAAPPSPFDRFDHPINLNVGTIRGGDWPSTVPGECEIGFRIALYPGGSIDELKARIESIVSEAMADQPGTGEVRYNGFSSHGYGIADDDPLVTTLAGSFASVTGAPPALVATTGTTDAAVFGNVAGIPAVCFGPYAEAAHGVGERVYLPSVVQTAQVLGLFIRDWCGLS
jgi:acetylornithine deacetylase